MIHEPFLPLLQDRLRHTVLAIIHRIMLAMVLRAAARIWIAIPKWEGICRLYARRSVPFTWLPVISNIPLKYESSATKAVRACYAPSHQYLIGHFGTCGEAIGRALKAVIPELLDRHADRMVLLIGADGKTVRDEIARDYPQLRNRLHVTGTLSVIDNTVDTATGTIHLKATFENRDGILWPGQFVTSVLTLDTLQDFKNRGASRTNAIQSTVSVCKDSGTCSSKETCVAAAADIIYAQ